jgi:tetratricopeptide (TPR) repeat protein
MSCWGNEPVKRLLPFVFSLLLFTSCATREAESENALKNGMVLVDQGRYDEAVMAFDEGLEKDATNAKLLYDKAIALFAAGRYDEGCLICEHAFSLYPGMLRFLSLEAESLAEEGKTADALTVYDRILECNPGDTDLRLSVMKQALDAKLYDEAKRYARWFIAHKTNLQEAYATLAVVNGKGSVEEEISSYLKEHPVTKAT